MENNLAIHNLLIQVNNYCLSYLKFINPDPEYNMLMVHKLMSDEFLIEDNILGTNRLQLFYLKTEHKHTGEIKTILIEVTIYMGFLFIMGIYPSKEEFILTTKEEGCVTLNEEAELEFLLKEDFTDFYQKCEMKVSQEKYLTKKLITVLKILEQKLHG